MPMPVGVIATQTMPVLKAQQDAAVAQRRRVLTFAAIAVVLAFVLLRRR